MAQAAQPIPEGFHTLTPHLVIRNAAEAIEFYKKAMGAEEVCRMPGPDGKAIMHAELRIGNSMMFVCDEFPKMGAVSPQALGNSPVTLHLYVEDVDKSYQRAIDAGATERMPPQDMFWGDRYGSFADPFGHNWSVASHTEDLTPEEIGKRAAESMKADGSCV